ncbi:formylglycine-generating enzyme family protein [Subtercola endophyticus]|uniref:formylglycine-generating enzyme family protein n=1 Tax=Subtercola endophyticus TaxID=2895559 RepID=UPI001E4C9213|nr:formylglycine-generating enzyme family protein [Subtercola endophyticus]UFS59558.1 formylglycine-generating enzyme family protein [Subtercola endophyticus]
MATDEHPGMVWVPGGTFVMGSDSHYPEESPAHPVTVDGFYIDTFQVTNRRFAAFVEATGHVTVAERAPDAADYPGADPALLVPASSVFEKQLQRVDLSSPYNWWRYVPGADWRHPQGPGSSIDERAEHPVVHVAWEDVEAYAAWVGKTLPTEAEWEFAARGGLDGAPYAWGDEMNPGGVFMANTWQGDFPMTNTLDDGFEGTAPVGSFPANGYGLYDMIGNAWEWTSDWYAHHADIASSCCTIENPRGGLKELSVDPGMPGIAIPRRVMKGGSHLCSPNYCQRYRPAARMPQHVDTSTSHLGFRCIVR